MNPHISRCDGHIPEELDIGQALVELLLKIIEEI
jgi:hypothetical protein